MDIALSNHPVAGNVKRLMCKDRLSVADIAKRTGYTAEGLADMLNGWEVIAPADIIRLAVALGVTVDELFK